jgi:exosortase
MEQPIRMENSNEPDGKKQDLTLFLIFACCVALAFFVVFFPLRELYSSASNREYYSHIMLIPFVSLYFLYQERKRLFAAPGKNGSPPLGRAIGIAVVLIGFLVYFTGQTFDGRFNQNDFTSIIAASAVLFLNGAFLSVYGLKAYKIALFPMLFLIFVIPLPSPLMSGLISFLQVGSTEFANLLFLASGVPFVREGFVFHLPVMTVEVAPQCSGIRSGMALFITVILAGQMFLSTWWKKLILLVIVIPMTMFKNGIRIITLTLLGNYVDPRILQSSLHKEGGIPFFVVALLLMAPILFFLRKSEKKREL